MAIFPPHHQYRDFLDPVDEQALLDWALASEADFSPSLLNGDVLDLKRRKSRRLPDLGPLAELFEGHIRDLAPDLFERTGVPPFEIEHVELEIAAHGDGAHFAPHSDIPIGRNRVPLGGDGSATQDRIVSAVYYFYALPRRFTGGELRLHRFGSNGAEGDWIDIDPIRNSLLIFPSWAYHEVRPVALPGDRFAEHRFAINCWLCRTLPSS